MVKGSSVGVRGNITIREHLVDVGQFILLQENVW